MTSQHHDNPRAELSHHGDHRDFQPSLHPCRACELTQRNSGTDEEQTKHIERNTTIPAKKGTFNTYADNPPSV